MDSFKFIRIFSNSVVFFNNLSNSLRSFRNFIGFPYIFSYSFGFTQILSKFSSIYSSFLWFFRNLFSSLRITLDSSGFFRIFSMKFFRILSMRFFRILSMRFSRNSLAFFRIVLELSSILSYSLEYFQNLP